LPVHTRPCSRSISFSAMLFTSSRLAYGLLPPFVHGVFSIDCP
jgi:hypothetical protein